MSSRPSRPEARRAAVVPTPRPRRALLDELDERIRARLHSVDLHRLDIALDLYTIDRLELYQLDGFTSVTRYAGSKYGMASSTTSELKALGRACHEHGDFHAALRSGALGWVQAHELLPVIHGPGPKGEPPGKAAVAAWIERVRGLDIEQTREAVNGERFYRRGYRWTGEQLAEVDLAIRNLRKELPGRSNDELVAELCRRHNRAAVSAPGAPTRPPHLVAIRACECGEKGERPSSSGPIPVPRAEVERMRCDAYLVNEETGRITRTIPAATRRAVEVRGLWHCSVPGCFDPDYDLHHELGWENGHDPAYCGPLCRGHHRQRHAGLLRIEGTWPDAHFYTADGTYLGKAGDPRRATTPRPESGRSSRQVIDQAVKALRKLEVKQNEAKALVTKLVQANPGRDWSSEELIHAALAASPLRASMTVMLQAPGPVPVAPEAPAAEVGAELVPPGSAEMSPASSTVDGLALEDANRALRSLDLSSAAARQLLEEVIHAEAGRKWTRDALVDAVLARARRPSESG